MRPLRAFAVAALGTAGILGVLHTGAGPAEPRPLPAPAVAPSSGPARRPPGASLIAVPRGHGLPVFRRPRDSSPELRLGARTAEGSRQTLLVAGVRRGWVRVWLPVRPNGSRGWVRVASVRLESDDWSVRIRLRRHRLTVLRDGVRQWSALIAVGAPATPTPRGRFFVTDLLRQPDPRGIYGPWVFALSGFSRVLTSFRGGHGEIGIHGTDEPMLLGQGVSHGCIRLRNSLIARLAGQLPLGTPVMILDS